MLVSCSEEGAGVRDLPNTRFAVWPLAAGRSLHHLAALGRAVLGIGGFGEALALAGILSLAGAAGALAGALSLAGVGAGALHTVSKGRGSNGAGREDGGGGRDQRTLVHENPPG